MLLCRNRAWASHYPLKNTPDHTNTELTLLLAQISFAVYLIPSFPSACCRNRELFPNLLELKEMMWPWPPLPPSLQSVVTPVIFTALFRCWNIIWHLGKLKKQLCYRTQFLTWAAPKGGTRKRFIAFCLSPSSNSLVTTSWGDKDTHHRRSF